MLSRPRASVIFFQRRFYLRFLLLILNVALIVTVARKLYHWSAPIKSLRILSKPSVLRLLWAIKAANLALLYLRARSKELRKVGSS